MEGTTQTVDLQRMQEDICDKIEVKNNTDYNGNSGHLKFKKVKNPQPTKQQRKNDYADTLFFMDVEKRHTVNSSQQERFLRKWKMGRIEVEGIAQAKAAGLVDEVTGMKSWKRMYVYLEEGNWTVMREFHYTYDSSIPRTKESLLTEAATIDHYKLPMLESGMDYIAYDMNGKVFAAYFEDAHICAHGQKIGNILVTGTTENMYHLSKWQSLGIDTSDRHGMTRIVSFLIVVTTVPIFMITITDKTSYQR